MKKINHGTIEIHTGQGNIVACDIVEKSKLMKNDRMIDHAILSIMEELTLAEIKVLITLFKKCNKINFLATKALETDLSRQTLSNSLKVLTDKNLIRKTIWIKGVRTSVNGYMINPFYYRKTRKTEDYFKMEETYKSFNRDEILIITMKEEYMLKQDMEDMSRELLT